MPANPKYLSTKFQRFLKTSASIFGAFLLTLSFHFALGAWLDHVVVLITSTVTSFLVWVSLMVVAYLSKSGGKIWGLYFLLTVIFLVIFYLGKQFNPSYLGG